jgi:Zn-dependent protease with chaperone function
VFVSSRVWSSLPVDERNAVIAHEHAHMQHGDLAKRFLLESLLLFAAPFAAERIRSVWLQAGERLCDAHAAAETDAETVAKAMVSMCKLGSSQATPSFAFTPATKELAGRIEAVLNGGPLGERAAVLLLRTALVMCALLAIAGVAAAEPLHHAYETLLG